MNKKILIGVGILIFIAVGILVLKQTVTGNIIGNSEDITIPLSEITETARFYGIEGTKFFAVKAEDGTIKTAFDACDVCYYNKKGYRQEGNFMVCNNCENKYLISALGTENIKGGGCWPGYLPSKIEGANLIIKKSDLEEGRYRF